MDAKTLEIMRKFLPDPTTYPKEEYYYYAKYLDKEKDQFVETKNIFRKDPRGEQWVYIETLAKKGPEQES